MEQSLDFNFESYSIELQNKKTKNKRVFKFSFKGNPDQKVFGEFLGKLMEIKKHEPHSFKIRIESMDPNCSWLEDFDSDCELCCPLKSINTNKFTLELFELG